MHLKTLTMRGFKSFASTTTLELEPGITAVVGPNGSGKSNVVDALAWVMGEQGARSLRGGSMADVIFAGTAGKAPLGRAEVRLTIDNVDGALPIDYAEVTLSRTLFRSGGSEYAINGEPCRLLDIVELLSDSGIGREMHVVVGQGQLDAVLHATPEGRRGFVEEAAGVLKHRKRKEKALRKLDAMQGNLTRVADLTAELRRQLKPLAKQAEVARRASSIQAEVRDARLRLLADDLVQLSASLEADLAEESALHERRQRLEAEIAESRAAEEAATHVMGRQASAASAAQATWVELSRLGDRVAATRSLADERIRTLASVTEQLQLSSVDPDQLDDEADALGAQADTLRGEVEKASQDLDQAVERRTASEGAANDEQLRVQAAQRAAADRQAGVARLGGQVSGLRGRIESTDVEIARQEQARDEAQRRAREATEEFHRIESSLAAMGVGEEALDREYEQASDAVSAAREMERALREELGHLERECEVLQARCGDLSAALEPADGAAALTERELPGLHGVVAELVSVADGWERAVAAGLGPVADALAMDSTKDAVAALDLLRAEDLGAATILAPGGSTGEPADREGTDVTPGIRAADVVTVEAPAEIAAVLTRLLQPLVLVESTAEAMAVLASEPGLVVATRLGDVVTDTAVRGGSRTRRTQVEVQAAHRDASRRLAEARSELTSLRFRIRAAEQEREGLETTEREALGQLHDSDAQLAAAAERLGALSESARAAGVEVTRHEENLARSRAAREGAVQELADLEARLAAARDGETGSPEVDSAEADRRNEVARQARESETQARLRLRTLQERQRSIVERVQRLHSRADAERRARDEAERQRVRRQRQVSIATTVTRRTDLLGAAVAAAVAEADALRSAAEEQRAAAAARVDECRARILTLSEEMDGVVASAHRDEVARAEIRLRIEAIGEASVNDWGVPVESLVEEYGPHLMVPPDQPSGTDSAAQGQDGYPFVRAEQEKRAVAAERDLARLGRVNPLALEEFAAHEERLAFLTSQLEDLRKTRADLLGIVKEVDQRVEAVFVEAFHDTAREFAAVFSRLFPGGEGRLVLTDPEDMLATGIEIEARPPGKKVKRLSLLSGGERSLVAVAFLVSLFKARPSPFYVLDEVEAALDDTNLGRVLEIYEELRADSQLIVVTHQKRTMEVADALYGVSMRGDGVSAVVSQRLREPEPV